jgi:DNA repair protein RadA/Sms
MAKSRSIFVCNGCGAESPQYFGRCPVCGSWNTLVEQAPTGGDAGNSKVGVVAGRSRSSKERRNQKEQGPRLALTLAQIEDRPQPRSPSGYGELDRVLGGGIVPGSLVLVGGDPGIGKSTLLLQVANHLSTQIPVLYVCAEESGQQVKLRSQRLGIDRKRAGSGPTTDASKNPGLYLLPEIDLETILMELESLHPPVAIIDSIQALYYNALTSAPGSVPRCGNAPRP